MENISLRSIKNESIKKMFAAVTSKEYISRSEISDITGLSLMTVGKIADAFLELGIITQKKETKNGAGRKAGLVSLTSDHYAVVLDLSEKAFTLNIIDLSLHLSDSMTYTYNGKLYYDENLYMFFKSVSRYISTRPDKDKLIGVGITLPGIYIASEDRVISTKVPELNTISIKKLAEEIISLPISLIIKNVEAAALSYVKGIPAYENKVVIYMYMGECVDGAVYNRGTFVKGARESECDFGRMILRYGETLEERIRQSHADIEIADELSSAVYNIITILDPDAFIIESELPRNQEFIILKIKESLVDSFGMTDESMPEFLAGGTNFRHSARGVAMKLRDIWLDSII